ncbi:TRAP dicarboxylate transporter, DctQ subunit, unknown substrate 6 [hydrothermal vent metagenome]|uniref:Tripartite ATP-independent periplasmic transporters DctQ component domain-containing protein n=1 Tax=hydrothermal vent metagenome TaxID=652676 RepID=A0A3B0YTS4_9ZZZZ
MNFLANMVSFIDRISEWSGRAIAWLVLALVLLVCYDVAMRYLWQSGSIALQELEWHLFALIFLLGAAYTLKHDEHVRVDLLYGSRRFSEKHRAMVNLSGSVLLLIPFCILIIYASWPFVATSYAINEVSSDPGGLSHRFLIKAAIPLGFTLLLIQGISEIGRNIITLKQYKDGKE